MLGTLVLCLPSRHTGGVVELSHDGDRRSFDSASSSDYGYSIAGWYADVTHEVLPVTSGCRVAVTFNLVVNGAGTFTKFAPKAEKLRSFDDLIKEWDDRWKEEKRKQEEQVDHYEGEEIASEKLIYVLSHKYSEAAIKLSGLAALKGKDRVLGDFLVSQNNGRSAGYGVYIAHMTKHVEGVMRTMAGTAAAAGRTASAT